jgi:diaminohydroxyphosphoribosylaminopyrimidine deaminase/5-amino-6-(5-phosphoribosylamino)uracil reductase
LTDESYIQLAIEIAKKGIGSVSPNPLVGCVIVKNNKIIGAGYHQKFGGSHAETNAINDARENVEGSTLYTNLEPCSHHGKTPPCVNRIIEKKIRKVVIGTLDMNPLVSGQGIKKLKAAGVEVKVGVLENECVELNKFFFKFITKKIPYVTLKAAQTADGRIAGKDGESKWISSLTARKYVHSLRAKYDALLVGAGTVLKDDPRLTVRLTEGRNPKRVVLDTNLRIKSGYKIFTNNGDKKLILFTSKKNSTLKNGKIRKIFSSGAQVIYVKESRSGKLNLKNVLKELGKLQISSVLVEGGSEIYTSFVKENLFDDIQLILSPRLLGCGIPLISSLGIKSVKKSVRLKIGNFEKIGDDVLIELSK